MPTPVWKKVEKTKATWQPVVYGILCAAILLEIILKIFVRE